MTASVSYETAEAHIASSNSDVIWIKYDSKTHTTSITSIEDFVTHCKAPSKPAGAFDDINSP